MNASAKSIDYTRLLPGVPHIESPFFARIIEQLELDAPTRQIAVDLFMKGYAVIDFPEPEFDGIAESIKADMHDQFDWEMWHSHGHRDGVSLRIMDAWKTNQNVRRLASNAKVMDLLSLLYGRRAWPFQTLNFPVGSQQHVHTDAVHFSSNPERFMCGVWVALEDITAENGPLEYYPGSHKWPIYTNEHIGQCVSEMPQRPGQGIYEEMWRALIEANHARPETFVCKKGQALIWCANLMHGGSIQLNKDLTRWSQVTHYLFEDCAYYTPLWSDPFYGHVYFRRPTDISRGEVMASRYVGRELPENFIEESKRGHLAFDPKLYLAANPDVAAAGMDAWLHYALHGKGEKRPLRPEP